MKTPQNVKLSWNKGESSSPLTLKIWFGKDAVPAKDESFGLYGFGDEPGKCLESEKLLGFVFL